MADHPGASGNEVQREVRGRREDVQAAVRRIRGQDDLTL